MTQHGHRTHRITFALPFDESYARMATASARSIRAHHPSSRILALSVPPVGDQVSKAAGQQPFDGIREIEVPDLDHAGYSPNIWLKFAAWTLEDADTVVCIDADTVLLESLCSHIVEWKQTNTEFAAALDLNPTMEDQFKRRPGVPDTIADVPAMCAACIICEPDRDVAEELFTVAREYDGLLRCPEQAVLSIWASKRRGWHDLGDRLLTQTWGRSILSQPWTGGVLHIGSPRPQLFGSSPLRSGEHDLIESTLRFERTHGVRHPMHRIVETFKEHVTPPERTQT